MRLQVLMPAHRLQKSQFFLAVEPWSRCLLSAGVAADKPDALAQSPSKGLRISSAARCLSKRLRTDPRFVCKHFAADRNSAQERFVRVLCKSSESRKYPVDG